MHKYNFLFFLIKFCFIYFGIPSIQERTNDWTLFDNQKKISIHYDNLNELYLKNIK